MGGAYQDTHIHIQDIKSPEAIAAFLAKTKEISLGRFFNCAITPSDWPLIKALSLRHAALVPFFGFHPWFADLADNQAFQELEQYLRDPSAFAGEMGLDKARKNIDFGLQKDVFIRQLILAKGLNKPLAVHCVRAWEDTIRLIKDHATGLRFLMHSFNGPEEISREIGAMSGFFSVSIKEFFRPQESFRKVFASLPKERILIETDFPYQVKWTNAEDYLLALRQGYELAASWRGVPVNDFIKDLYDNGTVFTNRTSDRP